MTPADPLTELQQTQDQQPQYDPREDPTQPIGDNFQNLKKELQLAIWALLMEQERQDEIPRRLEIKKILRRRLLYRGEQYWWWSDLNYTWNPPSVAPVGLSDWQEPEFQYVTNIFRAYSESLQSVLSQNNTAAKFFPEDASDEQDVITAKQASKAVGMVHRNNDWQNRVDEMTYFMCTDGFLGGHVRYVADGERFGFDEQPIMQPQDVPLGEPMVSCPQCTYADLGTTEQQPTCPDCGQPLQDNHNPTVTVPVQTGTMQIPKGQEVISIMGGLQLRRNMWADHQSEFLYMTWISDIHRAKAMATYPWAAQDIKSSAGSMGESGTSDSYERIARRLLYLGTGRHTGMVLEDLGVCRRAWLRPAIFELETRDDIKAALQQLFPKGCAVVFYNDVYCESRNEGMDEKWETMQTIDGEGQVRETLVSSLEPIQDQLNDAVNLLFEQLMNGVAEGFGDQNTIDFEARSEQTASPGNFTPVDLAPNQDIRQKVLFSPSVEPSAALVNYIQLLLGEVSQFLTGAFPALFGGNTGTNDTASGIAIQRNQALGRIGRAWRRLQIFCANLDGKAVTCMGQNRTNDVQIPKESDSGEYEADFIRVVDLQGNIIAYPETDSQYPTLQADVRGLILSLVTNANPLFLGAVQDSANLEYVFDEMGLGDIQAPGAQQRKKTNMDIQQLLQEKPAMGQTSVDPQSGQPVPGQPIPSVEPDPVVDDLPVALKTTRDWLISDQGMQAKNQNPAGWQNVYLFAKAADQLMKQAQFSQALAASGLAGKGPGAEVATGGAEHLSPPPPKPPAPPGGGPQAANGPSQGSGE